jgi:hypothetical protein
LVAPDGPYHAAAASASETLWMVSADDVGAEAVKRLAGGEEPRV